MAIVQTVYTVPTFVTGATATPSIEIPGCFLNLYLVVPTMTTGYAGDTQIWVKGSADNTNFYRYTNVETNTNTVGANDFVVASATSQRIINLPNFGIRYFKIEVSGAVTNNISLAPQFKVICVSNQ